MNQEGHIMQVRHVAAAIIKRENKILATQRGHGAYKGFWEFPGGKLEPGETARDAVVRELREELDAEIQVEEAFMVVEHDYPEFHLVMTCFLCSMKGDIKLFEHMDARWLDREHLEDVNWLPADGPVIEKLKTLLQEMEKTSVFDLNIQKSNDQASKIGEKKTAKLDFVNSDTYPMKVIARIRNDFPTKFGIPRQSGLVKGLKARIVFEPEYRNPDALRGLEEYSHIWLIWQFSEAVRADWSPTVRPPRLGGNTRKGVFATRSPFRPNSVGLSVVKLEAIHLHTPEGPVLEVSGADLMDGTPIWDIKPYLPHIENLPEATAGFAGRVKDYSLEVEASEELLSCIPSDKREGLLGILSQDPRPSYQNDPERVYGFEYAGFEVKFTVSDMVLRVRNIMKL